MNSNQSHLFSSAAWMEERQLPASEPIISPSLLAACSSHYAVDAEKVERAGAEFLHIDVMDGHFVPNLSFGPNIVAGLRPYSKLFFDVHLMIEHPMRFVEAFADAGADGITVHPETVEDMDAFITFCKQRQIKCGIALKPDTPFEKVESYLPDCDILLIMSIQPGFGGQKFMPVALDRITKARELRESHRAHYRISVDGGINPETGSQCVAAGADILIAGSAIFGCEHPETVINALKGNTES